MQTCWAIKQINHFYSGTFYAPQDAYVRPHGWDDVIAVADKATAQRVAEALEPRGTYYLAHGEYAPPEFEARRIKFDQARVHLVDESEACRLLDLEYDLEVAE